MNPPEETPEHFSDSTRVPEQPVLSSKGKLPVVWLIPLVAVAIGVWLIVHTLNQKGPNIEIQFDSANGLEAGKTKIKLRDVTIGLVNNIRLGDDASSVFAEAALAKDATRFLNANSSFWIVRPRIEGTSVSGLGTLVSGAYIAMAPGKAENAHDEQARTFVGLTTPPVREQKGMGKSFILEAERRGSLTPGSPVYLRDLLVGEVTNVNLVNNNSRMDITVFINAPYDQSILSTTRFWNASGIGFSVSADGVDVQVASIETLISGGIAFETLGEGGRVPPENAHYRLYSSRNQIDEFGFTEKIPHVMYFDNSVRGLTVDAPVEFRGIKMGSVRSVNAEFDAENARVQIPVVVDLEPERIDKLFHKTAEGNFSKINIDELIKLGLRAQLQTGSLLTGQLFISLDFHPDTEIRLVGAYPTLPELPTIPTVLGKFEDSATAILNKLQKIPIEALSQNLVAITAELKTILADPAIKQTIAATKTTVERFADIAGDFDQRFIPELQQAIGGYDSSSAVYIQMLSTLEEMQSASAALRALAEELERSPESILRGKP